MDFDCFFGVVLVVLKWIGGWGVLVVGGWKCWVGV